MITMMTVMMRIIIKKTTMVERIPEILVTMIVQYCAKLIEHTKNVTIEKVIYLSSKSKIDVTNIKTLLTKLIDKTRKNASI